MTRRRKVDKRTKKERKPIKISWKWIVAILLLTAALIYGGLNEFETGYPLWSVMTAIVAAVLIVGGVPRIVWAHLWVIVTGVGLTFLDLESTDMLVASILLMMVYILSIGKEQKASSRPSKAEGRLKFTISFIAIVIWVLFIYSWALAVSGQLVDNIVWETVGRIFFMLPIIGIVASIVEIRSTIYITIESRTPEDFIRQDDTK